MKDVKDYGPGDLYQEIDEAVGPPIEKAVQRYLPREMAREVRKQTVRYIGDYINPPLEEAQKAPPSGSGIYPSAPEKVAEKETAAPGTDAMVTLIAKYHEIVRFMRAQGIDTDTI